MSPGRPGTGPPGAGGTDAHDGRTPDAQAPQVKPPHGSPHVGRFAPTPSGPLHLGSLTAAVISWLDARHPGGRWHLRIDDIDRPRVAPGAIDTILRDLEGFGLGWDGPVLRQRDREPAYHAALDRLQAGGHVFPCACSRQAIAAAGIPGWEGPIYPGTCREGLPPGQHGRTLRLRITQRHWSVPDRGLGPVGFDLLRLGGDFVVRRADGLFAYQLATVVDDLALGVTDVVRGIDLLGSVPRQLQLHQALGQPAPRYLHHPLVVADTGEKLAKSSGAAPLQRRDAGRVLARVLNAVGVPDIDPDFAATGAAAVHALLDHARQCWQPERLPQDPIADTHLRTGAPAHRGTPNPGAHTEAPRRPGTPS